MGKIKDTHSLWRTGFGGAPQQLHALESQQTNAVARSGRSSFDPDYDGCPDWARSKSLGNSNLFSRGV